MVGKYVLETERSIRDGIAKGLYTSSTYDVVRDANKSFVRHLKRPDKETIPASVAQISNTIIIQADMERFVSALIETKNTEIADGLEIDYRSVLNNLAHYKDFGTRLDQLNSKSLDAISSFELRSEQILKDYAYIHKESDRCLRILDSYVNMLFVYVMSGYWHYREDFSKDTTALLKLDDLEKPVKEFYEWLLQNGSDAKRAVGQSVYAHIFLDKPDEINLIGTLVQHDRRYASETDFFRSYGKNCIGRDRVSSHEPYRAERPHPWQSNVENRFNLALSFHDILDKIANIRDIIYELRTAGEIDESEIVFGEGYLPSPLSIFRIEKKPDA